MVGFCLVLGVVPALCILLTQSAAIVDSPLGVAAGLINGGCWLALVFMIGTSLGFGLPGMVQYAPLCMSFLNAIAAVAMWRGMPPVYPPDSCQTCGYTLKYLTEPRCPECGTPCDLPKPGQPD